MTIDQNKKDDPIKFAEEFARNAIAEGFNFDFSINSLETEVDKCLEKYYSFEHKTQFIVRELMAAYIGETIRRMYDGKWWGSYYGPNNPNGDNYYSCKVAIGMFLFCPSHFIGYYFSNGKESEGSFREYLYGRRGAGLLSRIENEK